MIYIKWECKQQNNRYWRSGNPHVVCEVPSHYLEGGVWCAVSAREVSSPRPRPHSEKTLKFLHIRSVNCDTIIYTILAFYSTSLKFLWLLFMRTVEDRVCVNNPHLGRTLKKIFQKKLSMFGNRNSVMFCERARPA